MNKQQDEQRHHLPCLAAAVGIAAFYIYPSAIAASDRSQKPATPVIATAATPTIKNKAQAGKDSAAAARLKTLLVARRDLMKQNEERAKAKRQDGSGSAVDVTRATIGVLGAELDLEHTKAERIALREQVVAATRLVEEVAEGDRRNGVGNDESLFPARLARIEAEIALEREKLRPAP